MAQIFPIMPEEKPLIEAAIKLGDWLWEHKSVTKQQKKIIRDLQQALGNLPNSTPGLSASYGFSACDEAISAWNGETKPVPAGLFQEWCVCYYPSKEKYRGEQTSVIEIFNLYSPYPEQHYDCLAGVSRELDFVRTSEELKNQNISPVTMSSTESQLIQNWIEAVSTPERFLIQGVEFEIEILD